MSRLALAIAILGACAKPPARVPPPPELAVTGLATIAGAWVAADDLDWSYRLTIDAGGGYVLHVDRNRLGACDEKGTLAGAAKSYALRFGENQCHRELSNTAATLEITTFTGGTLGIAVRGDGLDERHVFTRAPAAQ